MQAEADAYTAVCLEPYSRTRVLAGFGSAAGQDAASETAALGGIAIIDVGTERLVSKVCPALRWHSQTHDSTSTAQKFCLERFSFFPSEQQMVNYEAGAGGCACSLQCLGWCSTRAIALLCCAG